ncbi:hypothetical protein PSPO01_09733 [Paraphaeosphaeria sporulosa]
MPRTVRWTTKKHAQGKKVTKPGLAEALYTCEWDRSQPNIHPRPQATQSATSSCLSLHCTVPSGGRGVLRSRVTAQPHPCGSRAASLAGSRRPALPLSDTTPTPSSRSHRVSKFPPAQRNAVLRVSPGEQRLAAPPHLPITCVAGVTCQAAGSATSHPERQRRA